MKELRWKVQEGTEFVQLSCFTNSVQICAHFKSGNCGLIDLIVVFYLFFI